MQGASAVGEIVRAIERLNRQGEADVILVGRGGGSIEDLWAFNEEPVARAIAASRIPVISCVGHEIDFTIADFVADLRAPTPSAAAELAVPVLEDMRQALDAMTRRMLNALSAGQQVRRLRLERVCAAPALSRPAERLTEPRRLELDGLSERLIKALPAVMERSRQKLARAETSLRALDPESVLKRGYAIVRRNESILTGVKAMRRGDLVSIHMSDGTADATVASIRSGEDRT